MKNIVITGATSGLGKELVKLFAKTNRVFASFRNKNLIEEIDNVEYFYMDMTDKDSICSAAKYINDKVKNIDLLINAAGCVIAGPIEVINTDKIREQFEINTFSHLEFTQKLLPLLDNSKIINISSMASFGHFPFVSPYCASKRTLDILFNALAIENHKNIKVVSIKPGVIVTPLWQKSINKNSDVINECQDYQKEMEFMKRNALKNETKGLNVENVAQQIFKIANKKNPKTSYTIGSDAKVAQILSIFPQDFINALVKFALNYRVHH